MADEIGNMGPADIAALVKNDKSGMGAMGAWFLLILFLFAGMNGRGGLFGNAPGGPGPAPAIATEAGVQRGFDQAALQGAVGGLSQQIGAGLSDAAVARCNAQQNLLQQLFGLQTALTAQGQQAQSQTNQGFNAVALGMQQLGSQSQQGIADLKYTIAQENCADRNAISNGIRDLAAQAVQNTQQITNAINGGIQGIQDKLCALQIESLKQDRDQLRQQAQLLALQASQQQQTGNIIQALSPKWPVPAYTVPNPFTGTTSGGSSGT